MGQALVRAIVASSDATVSGGTEVAGSKWIGRDVAEPCGIEPIGAAIGDDPEALFKASDVVLDFTAPAALLQHTKIAAATGTALVVGTTGANVEEDRAVLTAAKRTAIVRSANMSVGVNLLVALSPSIGSCCYEVGGDVRAEFEAAIKSGEKSKYAKSLALAGAH